MSLLARLLAMILGALTLPYAAVGADTASVFPHGRFSELQADGTPAGWVIPEQHRGRYQVLEEDGRRFLRYTGTDIIDAAPHGVFAVDASMEQVQIRLLVRVPELRTDAKKGHFRTLFINQRRGAMEGPRITTASNEWQRIEVTVGVNPRADAMAIACGFREAAGIFDIAEVEATVIKRRGAITPAPECTVRGGLPNVARKLADGADVTIAYFGGSITAQSGYRVQTLEWFRAQYPEATVQEINAGVGGTGSDLGAFRVGREVIAHQPDLVFVEFAVNDSSREPNSILESMEGIVRQIWRANPHTDICFVYTVMHGHGQMMLDDLALGRYPRAAATMEQLANHYHIPSIHMGVTIQQMERAGQVIFQKGESREHRRQAMAEGRYYFSSDAVHPYEDTGHVLYTAAIVRSMADILPAGTAGTRDLGAPLVANNWEDATMLPFGTAAQLSGWRLLPEDDALAKRFANRLPQLWVADGPGAQAVIRFKGSLAKIYDLTGPSCGRFQVTVNGEYRGYIDRFSRYSHSDYRITNVDIVTDLDADQVHTITLTIPDQGPDKRAILKELNEEQNRKALALDEAAFTQRFAGNTAYVGMLCIRGAIVP